MNSYEGENIVFIPIYPSMTVFQLFMVYFLYLGS